VQTVSDRARKLVPLILGIVTLAAVAVLFVGDAAPRLLPAGSHDVLAAFSLAMIALAYMVFQLMHRRPAAELVKTILLAAAFLFWAANQFWPNIPQASLFNDIAIGLFVLDVFFVIAGWPAGPNESLLDD
jgi:predicted signal transduction protein with EAL and GGDEF domain